MKTPLLLFVLWFLVSCSSVTPATSAPIDLATATPAELAPVQKALGMNACVVIHRKATAATPSFFKAAENTAAGRMATLAAAIATVASGDVVELVKGDFAVANGAPLTSFTAVTGWKINFAQGSSLVYANEVNAGSDSLLFDGTTRYAENFGFITGLGPGVDMQPRLQAALFSGIAQTNKLVAPAKYPGIEERRTRVILPDGEAYIWDTVYMTGHQQLLSGGARRTRLSAKNYFDNGVDEKFMVYVCPDTVPTPEPTEEEPNPTPVVASNFHFQVQLDLYLLTAQPNNPKTSLLYYSCGQDGKISLEGAIFQSGYRGIVVRAYSTYFEINDLDLNGDNTQTGPMLELEQGCMGFTIGVGTLQGVNAFTALSGNRKTYTVAGQTANLPAFVAYGCHSFSIHGLSSEVVGTMAWFHSCHNFTLGDLTASGANYLSAGEVMVRFSECTKFSTGGFYGLYYEKLYHFLRFGLEKQWVSNNALDAAPGIAFDQQIISPLVSNLKIGRADTSAGAFANFVIANADTPGVPGLFVQDSDGIQYMRFNRGLHTGAGTGTIQDTTGYSVVSEYGFMDRSKIKSVGGYAVISAAVNPTTADIPDGFRQTWRNTALSEIRDWTNIGGTLYKSAAYTP